MPLALAGAPLDTHRGGGISAGKISCRENFVTSPILLQGHQTWETSPPLRMHREQEVPRIAQQNFAGKFRRQTEKRKFLHEIIPRRNPPPPPGGCC